MFTNLGTQALYINRSSCSYRLVKILVEPEDEPILCVWCHILVLFSSNIPLSLYGKNDSLTGLCLKISLAKLKSDLETVSKMFCALLFNYISFSCKTNLTFVLHLIFQFVSLNKMPPMESSFNIMPSEAIPCAFFGQENGHILIRLYIFLCPHVSSMNLFSAF